MRAGRSLLLAAAISAGLLGASPAAADTATPLMLVTAAQQAAGAATSVHVKATIGAKHEQLDLTLLKGRGAVGSISTGGYTVKLIKIGTAVYAKGSPRFYARYVGGNGARLLRGKWLKGRSTGGQFKVFGSLLDMTTLLTQALSVSGAAVLTQGPTATVVGQPVVQIGDSLGGTLSIAATGTPFPVRLSKTGASGGSFTFTRWNGPVHLAAPVHVIAV